MGIHDIGIDLGTRSVIIYVEGKGVCLNEPSVVAVNRKTNEVIAVGDDAFKMVGKTPEYINAEFPLEKGVISNYLLAQEMVKLFIKKVTFGMNVKPNVAICVPSVITEVEAMAVAESARVVGARKVYLIDEPVAAAIGSGIDVSKPSGSLIVDIGGGTTDIAVISLNGIVKSVSIKVAGNDFDEQIIKVVRNTYGLCIGKFTAESIKKNIVNTFESEDKSMNIKGKSIYTRLPQSCTVHSVDFTEHIREVSMKIIYAVKKSIEKISPELIGDIYTNGILLTGGGSLLKGMDKLISKYMKTKCSVSDNALTCVAEGTGKSLSLLDDLQEGFRKFL